MAGELPAKRVIHTVGPIWRGGDEGEPETLRRAYRNSLDRAVQESARSVAFPSISTGAYGYPTDRAAATALEAVIDWLGEHPDTLDEVRFVLFSEADLETYRDALGAACG